MNQNIHYTFCPICHSNFIQPIFSAKDYSVSNATFSIWECQDCKGRFTQDIPSESAIGTYYQSENYISHSDTKNGIVNRLYHWVRSITLQQKRKFITQIGTDANKSILDVGAGTGAFANTMQLAGWKVTGIEVDAGARQIAASKFNLQFFLPNFLYQIPPETFQIITLWHVLEHVHDLHGYMKIFRQSLQPNGKLVIAVPNYTSYDAKYYQQYWAAYDVPRHLYHFSPDSMANLAAQHGFVIQQYQSMPFDSFYVALLSEQYKSGKSNFLNAGWVGIRSTFKMWRDTKNCSSVIYVLEKIN
ncbi:MAG: class I SAM-dependent methyltransferase [Bacteroidota bacterium]|jgi:2-polyprenyl-3-methyl-5-hydroxy-6-metoxy-1,4-benzoquinol methylase|nr:class I SAM-dependent methyltransferase [Bacteroidota bacterium]